MEKVGLWEEILTAVRGQLHQETFERWFGQCQPKDAPPNTLMIEVPSIFYRNWILEHYGAFILAKLRSLAGQEAQFVIQIVGDNGDTAAAPRQRRARARRPRTSQSRRPSFNNGSKLNPKYTFQNFVEAPCNRFARAASMAAAQAPGKAYNPLFIYGGVGLGKTHLMQAVGHAMLSDLQGVRIHYVSSETFTNHLINSLQTRKMEHFRRSYRHIDALLIDDIQFLSGKEQTQEEFFHTFNTLFDLRSQIVISSDRPPTELAEMEQRLVSRFQSGLVVDLQVPDLETRVVILLNNAAYLGIKLPEDVAFFIADKVRSNIRALEGALVRVASYASLMKQPLTAALAEHALKDILAHQGARTPTIDRIQKRVAELFDIRVADMKSPRRPRTIAFPRQIAMYLCRDLTSLSLQEIGEAFGGRNHATVLHAQRLVEERMAHNNELKTMITRLKDELCRA